jgi:hypothetical protein
MVRPSQGAIYLGRHQHREDEVLPHDRAAVTPVRHGGRGHHHLSTRTRPLHHAEDRVREAAVPLERTTHPPASYARDGRPQAIPVSEAPQEPCSRRITRLPPKHLVQPATHECTGHSSRPARGRLGRRSPLCGLHLRSRTPASVHPPTAPNFCRGSRTSPARWVHSAPSRTAFAPASGTLVSAPETQAPAPGIPTPASGTAAASIDIPHAELYCL